MMSRHDACELGSWCASASLHRSASASARSASWRAGATLAAASRRRGRVRLRRVGSLLPAWGLCARGPAAQIAAGRSRPGVTTDRNWRAWRGMRRRLGPARAGDATAVGRRDSRRGARPPSTRWPRWWPLCPPLTRSLPRPRAGGTGTVRPAPRGVHRRGATPRAGATESLHCTYNLGLGVVAQADKQVMLGTESIDYGPVDADDNRPARGLPHPRAERRSPLPRNDADTRRSNGGAGRLGDGPAPAAPR